MDILEHLKQEAHSNFKLYHYPRLQNLEKDCYDSTMNRTTEVCVIGVSFRWSGAAARFPALQCAGNLA
jgi:hypothetical protein